MRQTGWDIGKGVARPKVFANHWSKTKIEKKGERFQEAVNDERTWRSLEVRVGTLNVG